MEQRRNHDMQLVHTLAHYIHEGGQEMHTIPWDGKT